MAQRGWLAKVLMLAVLEMGAVMGIPIRPDEIEAIMRLMSGTTVEEVKQDEDSDDPIL